MFSTRFVYKARNPNFGGDSFNYQWLLNSADSQNLYKDPNDQSLRNLASSQDKFKDNLTIKIEPSCQAFLLNYFIVSAHVGIDYKF